MQSAVVRREASETVIFLSRFPSSSSGRRFTAERIVGLLACAAGLQPKPTPVRPRELAREFRWDRVTPRTTVDIRSILETL